MAGIGSAACMVQMGMVRDRYAILAAGVVLGLTREMARPAFAAMMTDIVPDRDRLRAFSLNYWAINLGFSFASVLAGLVAGVDFLLLFIIDSAATLVGTLVIFVRVPETRPDLARAVTLPPGDTRIPPRRRGAPARAAGLRHAFADRTLMIFTLLNLCFSLVFLQHITTLPMAMTHSGVSLATYGEVLALNGILIVAGQLFVPRLLEGRDPSRTLVVSYLVLGVGFGLTAFAHTATWYAGTVLIWTLGAMLNAPASSTLLAGLSPTRARGRYQGVFSLSWATASFAAPVLGGLVQQHLGDHALWLGCAAVAVAGALGQFTAGPARARRVAWLREARGHRVAEGVTELPRGQRQRAAAVGWVAQRDPGHRSRRRGQGDHALDRWRLDRCRRCGEALSEQPPHDQASGGVADKDRSGVE